MLLSEDKRKEALRILSELYPNPRPELNFASPYELLIAVMLSAQCTDKQVNKVTAELFQVANTPEQMMALDEGGFIVTDKFMQTSAPGVFAAGDIRNTPLRQVVTACADGAVAATKAIEYVGMK